MDEDVGVIQLDAHVLLVIDEVGREVTAVELHALDHLQGVFEPLALFHRDHALLADLAHGLGDDLADGGIGVGRDRAHLGDGLLVVAGLGELLQFLDRRALTHLSMPRLRSIGFRPAATDLMPFGQHRLGQHRGRGGTVTGLVGGVRGDLLDHLGPHVLEPVLELDLLGDRDPVLGDRGRSEALFQDHVAALGTEGDLHRVGEDVDAGQHTPAGIFAKPEFFCSHVLYLS